MSKKKALGRGLNALLSDSNTEDRLEIDPPVAKPVLTQAQATSGSTLEIPLSQIEVNPFQPRTHFDQQALQELADSIKVHGIIQPITVRRLAQDQYQLISGERRFQASKLAGLKSVPAYIRSADDQQMLEMALIENIQRENLNAIEVALSYQRLITECNLNQEALGDRVGKNRATVTNYLRLLKLPPDIQIAVRDNRISMGHARAIINVENPDQQLYIFKKTLEEDLSVRKVEELVRELASAKKTDKGTSATAAPANREINQLQSKLSSHFGTRIVIKSDGKKGEIKIPFLSVEDLNRILDILKIQ
ncbi:MAG TPA: ParB/RepB/Spo0J family partition protein [Cyclobacteriaceae bacterium]|nr:ParB/RepB/Spo0J family partition protein [Cyclobacteriaceae bacterium]HMV09644.1 ParB/RepB/Spo0J family partition protein [Cyclobacteriaceae bacterium]HMV89537.1 ParB/RepB/Spo0J family partition protein [Cyclobacteriaceae bacterium]HMX01024.1 ParB/RepB/Spo0J family partition protein [Cyclobacteriaceae bacterium]HMX52022.1 ParB/RepB/Spo0J family partition protein [Cyclobacteriaceae bacterium]